MLAFPLGDLLTAQYCSEPVTSFPSSSVMLPCPQGDCFTVKYGRDVHSYIVGTKREKKKKERKTKHRAGRQKKDPAFRRKRRAGNKRANKRFISGGRLMGLLPDPILEGVGDSLLTAGDRCAYTVSVP